MDKRKTSFWLLLTLSSLITAIVLMEFILRWNFSDTAYLPSKEVEKAQAQLELHNTLGYLYKKNLGQNKKILITWSDITPYRLYSDEQGFRNLPKAVKAKKEGKHINVIGVGDSLIHDAAYVFHDFFREKGLFYYNMAMHRHSPPQYNIIIKDYAVPLKPDLIIYGIYKNDFEETIDFEKWRESGVDWFTYHSGYWYGPAQDFSWAERFLLKNRLRGLYSLYRGMLVKSGKSNRILRENPNVMNDEEKKFRFIVQPTTKIANYIIQAYQLAKKNKISFLLVIIPSKKTILSAGRTFDSFLYNLVLQRIGLNNIPTLDLRKNFLKIRNRNSLYYKIDAHWNEKGMIEAGKAILQNM